MEDYLNNINEIPEETKNLFKNIKLIAFDFDGVFTDNYVYTNDRGEEMVKSSKLDGFGLNKLDKLGSDFNGLVGDGLIEADGAPPKPPPPNWAWTAGGNAISTATAINDNNL